MIRGSPDNPLIVPNVAGVVMSLFGRPRLTVLNRLNTSQRSVAAPRWPMRRRRCTVRSTFWNPGPRRRLRGSLPKVFSLSFSYGRDNSIFGCARIALKDSNCFNTDFARANSHCLLEIDHEDLAVTDFSSARDVRDCFHDLLGD